jgi:hypothetical protein
MSSITPGLWLVDRGDYWDLDNPPMKGAAVASVALGLGCLTIRAPETANRPCPSYEKLMEEGEANARLIAAAPEMLKALELISNDAIINPGAVARITLKKIRGEA